MFGISDAGLLLSESSSGSFAGKRVITAKDGIDCLSLKRQPMVISTSYTYGFSYPSSVVSGRKEIIKPGAFSLNGSGYVTFCGGIPSYISTVINAYIVMEIDGVKICNSAGTTTNCDYGDVLYVLGSITAYGMYTYNRTIISDDLSIVVRFESNITVSANFSPETRIILD